MDGEACVRIAEVVPEQRLGLPEPVTECIAVHEAPRGRLFTTGKVKASFEDHYWQAGAVLLVPLDQASKPLLHEGRRPRPANRTGAAAGRTGAQTTARSSASPWLKGRTSRSSAMRTRTAFSH